MTPLLEAENQNQPNAPLPAPTGQVPPKSGGQVPPKSGNWDILTPLLLASGLGLLLALSWPMPQHLYREYTQFESYYAYGPVIPFLVGFMLWHRRAALREAPRKPCWAALAVLVPSVALLIWSSGQELAWVMDNSFLLCVWSGIWLVMGTRWTRTAAFPLAFLLWMAPLPGPLLNDATYSSQHFCTQAAAQMLHIFGFHPVINGSIIQLDNFSLFVDVPCSGLKNLLSLMMISAAFAYLLDGRPARRIALFLFSVPLSIAVNVTRLTLLGVVGECFGTHAAHVFHDWDGLLSLVLGVTALFWFARRIGCRTFAGWPLF